MYAAQIIPQVDTCQRARAHIQADTEIAENDHFCMETK